ncbi:MAG: hypothetical protein QM654_04720 [Dysgonamonadaceae bacterium]
MKVSNLVIRTSTDTMGSARTILLTGNHLGISPQLLAEQKIPIQKVADGERNSFRKLSMNKTRQFV